MKCCECGNEMLLHSGYEVMDPNVGLIKTSGEYWECANPDCGGRIVPAATAQEVDDIRGRLVDRMLWSLASDPKEFADKFICVKDVARILGVSRQAVEKSVFVNALTYHIVVGRARYWLKESVERYMKTGNGKFPLATDGNANANILYREVYFGDTTAAWQKFISTQIKAQTSDKRNISRETGETCKSKIKRIKAQYRKSSHNRQQHQYSSICSTLQETKRIRYSIYPPAIDSRPQTMTGWKPLDLSSTPA